jgi:hypothetical protein
MGAAIYDLIGKRAIEKGATWSKRLRWLDDDGVPVVLTGWTAEMVIRPQKNSSETIISLTTENGRITLGGNAGTIDLLLTEAETQAFTFTNAWYRLELKSGGTSERIIEGAVSLSKG